MCSIKKWVFTSLVFLITPTFLVHAEELTSLEKLHKSREGGLHILERCASLNSAIQEFLVGSKEDFFGATRDLKEEYNALKHTALWIYKNNEVSEENSLNLFNMLL